MSANLDQPTITQALIDRAALRILKNLAEHVLTTNVNRRYVYPGPLASRQNINLAVQLAEYSLNTLAQG